MNTINTKGLGIIIQARTGSTRLPNKVVKPFYEENAILDIIIDKIEQVIPDGVPIVLATTTFNQDKVVVEKALKKGIHSYTGQSDDVLQRFIDAAENYQINKIIRVCGDNPFLNQTALEQLIKAFTDGSADYLSYRINGKPSILTHFGFWAEGVTLECLKTIRQHTADPLYHEHVTNYIYSHSDTFNIHYIDVNLKSFQEKIRLTVDTKEDFMVCQEIFKFIKSQHITEINDILKRVSENKKWLSVMKSQIIQNSK